LTAKGSPTRVDGQYMRLQRDFTLGSGSEERVHFRSLSKRTRDRILSSADEHNNDMRSTAERALAHVKKQKSQESQAHFLRREQLTQQGAAAMEESKSEYDRKLGFWQGKCDTLEKQKDALKDHQKTTLKKIEVWHYLVLSFLIFSCLVYVLVVAVDVSFPSIFVFVSSCLYLCVFVSLSLRLCLCVFVSLSFRLSVSVCLCGFVFPSFLERLSVWLFLFTFLLVFWFRLSFYLFAQTKEQMRNLHARVLNDQLDANVKKKVIVLIIICKLARVRSPFFANFSCL
jgi:hypothetical protein